MNYDYVPGIVEFIADLRRHGVKIALVTSSNTAKWRMFIMPIPSLNPF